MQAGFIDNRAEEVPFASVLADLLQENLLQHPNKATVFGRMRGTVAIALEDIDAAVTLTFADGRLCIDAGIVGSPELIVRTTTDCVMDLNGLRIVAGLPWYLDEPGRKVLSHLFAGRLKIGGIFAHPVLLTRLTKIMSVM
jgi:hypothetical protein